MVTNNYRKLALSETEIYKRYISFKETEPKMTLSHNVHIVILLLQKIIFLP